MNKYSIVNSIQAGPFTNNNKIIEFEIPEGNLVDMSQTFIQIVCHLDPDSEQVHNLNLVNVEDTYIPMNVDFIRNCWLSGQKVGRLEDVRRTNILNHNLLELKLSTSEKLSQINTIYQTRTLDSGMLLSPFVEMYKQGNVESRYVDAHFRVPMSHLFSLGDLKSLDTSKTGALRVHLELEDLTYLEVQEDGMFRDPVLENEGKFEDLTAAGNVITTVLEYESIERSPYFVGQYLNLTWSDNEAGEYSNDDTKITAITYDVATKKISLTLNYSFTTPEAPITEWNTIVAIETPYAGSGTLSIVEANLGLATVMNGKEEKMNELVYLTFTTEEYSNNSASLNKIFELEPNCVNAMVFFDSNDSNLISSNVNVARYRMRLDNVDIYDRNNEVNRDNGANSTNMLHDGLHYDSISKTFINAGMPLKNLSMVGLRRDVAGDANNLTLVERYTRDANKILIIATPTPMTNNTKKFQVNAETKAGQAIQNVIVFKQVVKQIKL